MDQHLEHYGLMEGQQRGVKSGCFGTMDNLLIDRAVILDCQRGKQNLSMAWIDVDHAMRNDRRTQASHLAGGQVVCELEY